MNINDSLELLDELLEQEITKYQRKDIKEVKNYLKENN